MKTKKQQNNYLFDNKAIAALIIPLVIEQILSVFVGMADSIMVASVGESAVSAVSLVDNICLLLMNLFGALATGGAVVAGQFLGQKDEEKARLSSDQLLLFIGISSVVITFFIYVFKGLILNHVFGDITPEVFHYSNIYLVIVAASIPFIALYNGAAAIFRTMGNSRITMKIALLMNLINVTGNAILIYGFHCGTEGVAIPTLISRMVAALVILHLLKDEKYPLHIKKRFSFDFHWNMIKKILMIGVPNGLENSMFQLGKILVLSLISSFGTSAIAANAVGNSLATFILLPGTAVSLAITPVVSRCVGAGDTKQTRYYTRKLLSYSYIFITGLCIVVRIFLPFFLGLYSLTPKTEALAGSIMSFYVIACALGWSPSFILPNALRAAGDVKFTMWTAIFSMWTFRIGFSYLLGSYFGLGLMGVWIAMVIDWAFRSVLFIFRCLSGKWKTANVIG